MKRGELYFRMKLALALHKTLKELDRDLGGSKELMLWKAMDVVDPFGSWRDDWRMAQFVELFANLHFKKLGGERWKLEEFIYRYNPPVDPEDAMKQAFDPKQIERLTEMLTKMFGAPPIKE